MGKVVKTVLKIAAVAAIAYFAPVLAAKLAVTIGAKGAIATTLLSSAIGAGAGEVSGVGWQAGLMAGGLGGAGKTGLFGGKAAAAAAGTGPPVAGAAPTAGAATVNGPAQMLQNVAGSQVATAAPVISAPAIAPAAGSGIGGALSTAGKTVGNVLKGGFQNVQAGITGAAGAVGVPTTIAGVNVAKVVPTLLAAGLVGKPGDAMATAQEAELARAQQVNAALTQQRIDQANQLYGEANYFDPEYMARQNAEAAMIRGGIQTAEQTRGLTGERLAAERRRMRLGTSRTAGTAYQQGYGTGVGARIQTRQAGLGALPNEYAMTNPASAIAARGAAESRRAEEIAGLSALFGQALGQGQTASRGT